MGPSVDLKNKRYRVRVSTGGKVLADKQFSWGVYGSREKALEAAEKCYKAAVAMKEKAIRCPRNNPSWREDFPGVRFSSGLREQYACQVGKRQVSFGLRKNEDTLGTLQAIAAVTTCRYVYEMCLEEGVDFDPSLFKTWRTLPLMNPSQFRFKSSFDGPTILVRSDHQDRQKFSSHRVLDDLPTQKPQPVTIINREQVVYHNQLSDQLRSDLLALEGAQQ